MSDQFYGYTKEVHEVAEGYLTRDILSNQTMLVVDMLKNSHLDFVIEAGFSIDEIENYTLSDDQILEELDCKDVSEEEKLLAIEEFRDNGQDFQEPYEWWEISPWLYEELKSKGHPVLSTNYGFYWGRCSTGQAIILDGTLQEIAKDYLK